MINNQSSFGAIFLVSLMKVARGHAHSSHGKSPAPALALSYSPETASNNYNNNYYFAVVASSHDW